jgi:predicted enzyme related to lactoylglutathione lyase
VLEQFYAGVFDWQVDRKGPGYALLNTPEGTPDGAISEAEAAGIVIGIVVPDLEEALDKVLRAGGQIVMPVTDNGWVRKAQVADPAGNRLTLIAA